MEFKILKSGGIVKQYNPSILTIKDDEFYFKKKENKDKYNIYHISFLNDVYIEQKPNEKQEYILILEINNKCVTKKKEEKNVILKKLTVKDKKDNYILSNIKKILNIKRFQYDLNLFLFNFKQKMKLSLNKDIIKKFFDNNEVNNIKQDILNNIEKKNIKEKINDLLLDKLNNFIKILNQNNDNDNINLLDEEIIIKIRDIINGTFILQNNENNILENYSDKFDEINKFNNVYLNLIKLLTQLRFCYILKRFKYYDKKYLLENQVINFNKNNHNNSINNINNEKNEINTSNESDILFSPNESVLKDTINNINEIKEDIQTKINKKKEYNENIQNRILSGLNSNTKMKENLKNLIISQNIKLYFCLKCNSLIEKTLIDKPNCNFDKTCTNRSFFYCKKCKIHFCTKCIVYQRGLKCSKNHTYFKKPVLNEETKCYICNKLNKIPYYECKFCKELICSDCASICTSKQNTCFNCNNELTWRKNIYTSCDRCHKLSECFYCCICCDYSICLNCASIPDKLCGTLHNLEEIDLRKNYYYKDKIDNDLICNKIYSFNYWLEFSGKCSWCNSTIGKNRIWGCLRCSLFLCEKCVKRNRE